jgi:L-iditol 2-dehydrogenase
MKAAVVEKPGVLVVRDVPVPEPGDYEALCHLLYGSTCSGTDSHLIDGTFAWPQPYPGILGHESIGRVASVGAKVRTYKPGDLVTRVCCPPRPGLNVFWGGFAECGIATDWEAMRADGLPADQWRGFRTQRVLPPGTDPAAATLIITWRETFSYISQLGLKAGGTLLVIGSGANALAFAAHGRNLGAAQVVLVGSPQRHAAALAVGATHVVGYRGDVAREAAALCPQGFDVAIDAVGRKGQPDVAIGLLKPGGLYALYGIDELGELRIALDRVWKPFAYFPLTYDEAQAHEAVMDFVARGSLRAGDFIDLRRVFPLERIADAFDHVRRRQAIKALVKLHD